MKNFSNITAIITHSGTSHFDERMAVALALAVRNEVVPVFRRDPTADEIADPQTLVIDVGDQYDIYHNNYDHHQRPGDAAPECAFSLIADAIGMKAELEAFFGWFATWRMVDSKGPFAWAKANGIDWSVASTLLNPDTDLVSEWWEESSGNTPVDEALVRRLKLQGEKIITAAERFKTFCLTADSAESEKTVREVQVFDLTWASADDAIEFGDAYAKLRGKAGGIIVSRDNRGPGLALFRREDDPRVDFTLVAGDPAVIFAHNGGFIAKTAEGADWRRLVAKAIKPPKAG